MGPRVVETRINRKFVSIPAIETDDSTVVRRIGQVVPDMQRHFHVDIEECSARPPGDCLDRERSAGIDHGFVLIDARQSSL